MRRLHPSEHHKAYTVCRWVHVLTTRYTFVNTLQLLGRDPRLDQSTQITLAVHAKELGLPTEPGLRQGNVPPTAGKLPSSAI